VENRVVKSWNILGHDLYLRKRLSDEVVKFDFNQKEPCVYPGLHVITEYPDLNFGATFFDEIDWLLFLQRTIYLSILGLIQNEQLEVRKYEDKKSWLFSLINQNATGFYLKCKDNSPPQDILSTIILEEVIESHSSKLEYLDLRYQFESIFDIVLGIEKEHAMAAKTFLKELIKGYHDLESWVDLIVTKKALGLYSTIKVEIDPLELKKLELNHKLYSNFSEKKAIENLVIRKFRDIVYERVHQECRLREPSDNDE